MNISLGEVAGLVSVTAYTIYIASIFRGKTKPSRSSWWILTFVGLMIFLTSYATGARENTWIQLAYVAGPLIIAILSVFPKYGYKTGLELVDKICLIGAFACLVIWLLFNSAFIALLGSIIVDFVGLVPTIKKSYLDPKEESRLAWGIEMGASILNAIAISSWFTLTDKSWIYALYLLIINGIITILLLLPRKGQKAHVIV